MEQQRYTSPQRMGMDFLNTVQILYQNKEIDSKQKQKITEEIRTGIRTSDFSAYERTLAVLRLGSNFKQFIDKDLNTIKGEYV